MFHTQVAWLGDSLCSVPLEINSEGTVPSSLHCSNASWLCAFACARHVSTQVPLPRTHRLRFGLPSMWFTSNQAYADLSLWCRAQSHRRRLTASWASHGRTPSSAKQNPVASSCLASTTSRFGCGSKPIVPIWGRCTTHFSLF